MNNKEKLDIAELVAMHKRAKELYRLGLFGVNRLDGVHINNDAFVELFGQGEITEWDSADFPYEHSATVDGVKFFCISESDKL